MTRRPWRFLRSFRWTLSFSRIFSFSWCCSYCAFLSLFLLSVVTRLTIAATPSRFPKESSYIGHETVRNRENVRIIYIKSAQAYVQQTWKVLEWTAPCRQPKRRHMEGKGRCYILKCKIGCGGLKIMNEVRHTSSSCKLRIARFRQSFC